MLLRAFRDPRASNGRGPKKTRWALMRSTGQIPSPLNSHSGRVVFVRGRVRTQGLYITRSCQPAPCAVEHRVRKPRSWPKKAQTTLSETTRADHPAAVASFCGAASARPESPLLQRPFAPQSCGTTVPAHPGAARPRDSAKATRRLYRTREKTKAASRREGDWRAYRL